jgi:hypothetical protein
MKEGIDSSEDRFDIGKTVSQALWRRLNTIEDLDCRARVYWLRQIRELLEEGDEDSEELVKAAFDLRCEHGALLEVDHFADNYQREVSKGRCVSKFCETVIPPSSIGVLWVDDGGV